MKMPCKSICAFALLLLTGCAGFTGKRHIGFDISFLGVAIRYGSTCDGEYMRLLEVPALPELPATPKVPEDNEE